ncbi:VCBS repeat-containing protein, partial [Candidatus Dependentiae bacterium]|nr:VCBS repeat-containing protein [Candidatus Dependentiae bacterium]
YILNAIAYNYLEMKGNKKRALEYSRKAVEIIDRGWELDFYDHLYTEDVWKKMKDEMKSSVYFNYARVMIEMKEYKTAENYIVKAQGLAHRGVDDEDTEAQFYYLFGLCQEKSKIVRAKSSYRFAIYAGDTRDRWTRKSEERYGKLLKKKYGRGVFPFKKKLNREEIYSKTLYYEGNRRASNIQFKDLTKVTAFKEVKAGRIAIGDYNNDGYDDILLNGVRLFKNKGNFEFEEVTDEVGLAGNPSNGGIWCDFNLDGLLDIYTISHKESGDKLWIQVEPGKFVDKTEEFGNITDSYPSEGCAVGDFNGDGWPDIYVANYEKRRESEFDPYAIGTPDKLYINKEGKGFREASIELGMIPPYGEELCGRGVSPCDFDDDGIQEIYVSNYRLDENLLWDFKDGKFVNIADDLKINGDKVDGYYGHTIGSVWGDIDNDGDFDLFCANLAHPRYIKFSNKSMFYINEKGNFTDKRAELEIKFEETHSDPLFADFNGSGELDIYITSIYPSRRSFFYFNPFHDFGEGPIPLFLSGKDFTYFSGVRVYNGWGCASSDFDNDGDLDLFVCSNSGVHIFENILFSKNFIQIKFIRGDKPQICEAGIRVYLKPGEVPQDCGYSRLEQTQMREVFLGRGTTSQDSTTIHFEVHGLYEFDVILQLSVSKKEIIVSNVKSGTILYFNLTTLSFAQQ